MMIIESIVYFVSIVYSVILFRVLLVLQGAGIVGAVDHDGSSGESARDAAHSPPMSNDDAGGLGGASQVRPAKEGADDESGGRTPTTPNQPEVEKECPRDENWGIPGRGGKGVQAPRKQAACGRSTGHEQPEV